MKTFNFNDTEVSPSFTNYSNNGKLAVMLKSIPDNDLFGVITINLCNSLQSSLHAFVDENNYPGIGQWLISNGIAKRTHYT